MQEKYNQAIIKLIVLLIGIAYFLKLINLIKVSNIGFFSYALLLYGIVSVYFFFNTNRKAFLFFNTAAFMSGILFYVLDNFEIPNPAPLILPSIVFILGGCFTILFLENILNKVFLFTAITLFSLSILLILISKYYFVRSILSVLGNLFLDYYPIILILIGILILVRNRK